MEQKRRITFIIPTAMEKVNVGGNYLPEIDIKLDEMRKLLKEQGGGLYDVHFQKMKHLINAEEMVNVKINTNGELLTVSITSFWPSISCC